MQVTRRIARGRAGRIVLGDWNPVVRDPIDVLRLSFLVGAVAFALAGDLGAAVRLLGTFALVLVARWIDPPRIFDLAFVAAMSLQGWGNVFEGFRAYGWYDDVVHVVLSGATAPLWYLLLVRFAVVPELEEGRAERSYWGIVVVTAALGLSFGALYEIYEYAVVRWLGAGLSIGYADTINDLAEDGVASLLGGLGLMQWARSHRGTERLPRGELARQTG